MESTTFFSFLAFLSLLFFLIKNMIHNTRVPPGSLGIPIIGQSLEFLKAMRADRTEEWLQERARKYGPISKLNIFGTKTVFLTGQAHNKFIYSSDEQTLSNKQPPSVRRLLGERNLLEMSSEDHRRMRGAILSFLKPEALKQYVGKMDQEIRLHLAHHWHHDHEISVMPLMKTLTFDMICTLLFGLERGERRETLVHLFQHVIDGMLTVPINLPFTRLNRAIRARSEAGAIIRALIREKREKLEREEGTPDEQDLIISLLSMRDDGGRGSPLLSDAEIEDNCAVAMIAGHDTTATLLTFLIKLIAENPHVYEALLNEQEEIARGKKTASEALTWEDLGKMKYTWRIATEALRMYPPVMFSFRQVLRDIQIGGYVIPKGWQVFWAGCMTHLDGSIYPDPHKFDPSRYEDQAAIPPHSFVAFGGGPRMCPGYEFSRIETLAMIHYLVTRFTWKLCFKENNFSRDPMPIFKQGLPIHIQMKKPLSDDAVL
ncbi:LOW QUALITY PROTEIN: cytochrome P450 716B1-like [Salvia miltiorrhiza]|uniref:LOW QUALITY PROTEIN: cytochrome P450 716B1-like n=1 Tax=Salvia miltiorrhiza TaxID=226208 RepID=UPI0025AB5E49|nr:LOW QUALITY PROTEIN: cytochrome P450 716B1-like [Salvia miltiorrhiza]